jgi:hypothetical protein
LAASPSALQLETKALREYARAREGASGMNHQTEERRATMAWVETEKGRGHVNLATAVRAKRTTDWTAHVVIDAAGEVHRVDDEAFENALGTVILGSGELHALRYWRDKEDAAPSVECEVWPIIGWRVHREHATPICPRQLGRRRARSQRNGVDQAGGRQVLFSLAVEIRRMPDGAAD